MLQFDGEKWVLYKRKVSYKAPYEFYTDEVDLDISDDWLDVEIETIDLNFEQIKRFEQVQYFENAGVDDLVDYILEGEIPLEDLGLKEKITKEQIEDDKTQAVKSLTDFENASLEDLEELYFLNKEFKHGILIEENDLVEFEGGLYLSLQDHVADENYPPDTTNYRYVVKRKGTHGDGEEPDLWVQPTGYENVYNKGDRVKYFDGFIYVSKIDGNSQEPTKDEPYNRYWELEQN